MAEIDDIFTSKKISKAATPIISTSIPPERKQTKNKKRKRVAESTTSSQSNTRPAPEIVIDSSANVNHTTHAKRLRVTKTAKDASKNSPLSARKKTDYEMESKFQDSRGSESRRKTEEGWAIYKEDELGIHDKGGDTPLCPFDCECCF